MAVGRPVNYERKLNVLILGRKKDQSIFLMDAESGKRIAEVKLIKTGGKTRFGIEAPKSVRIVRGELLNPVNDTAAV